MKHKQLFWALSVVILFSFIMTACAPKSASTTAAPSAEKPVKEPAEALPEPSPTPRPPYNPADFKRVVTGDCTNGQIIKEIAAVDDLTVKFTLCVSDPAFLQKVAFSSFSIQPREYLEKAIVDRSILEKPIGTGPYMLDKWNHGDSITFKRFDDYWGTKAKAPNLVFRWNEDDAQRLQELQSGTVDGVDNPNNDDFVRIQEDKTLAFYPRVASNVFYVGMTNTFPPFDNKLVRQAIALGIDRERIVADFMPAGSVVADYFSPCSIENGCVGEKWYKFDAKAARELLRQAGYPEGFKTKIYYQDMVQVYLPKPGVVATELQSQLKANLNIDAEIVIMESGTFIDAANNGLLDGLYLLGWVEDYHHITNWLDFHFAASNTQFGKSYPEIYENLQQGAKTADAKKAESYYAKANDAVKEFVPCVPIAHVNSATVFKADVKRGHASPLDYESFAVMTPGKRDTLVWMQNAEPISLYCNDETDVDSFRACEQVLESLLAFKVGGTEVVSALATSCNPNKDLTEWTCHLRKDVKFHDGSTLDAEDVLMSWVVAWDYTHPLHLGNAGTFHNFTTFWGNFLHAPPVE